MIRLLHIADIHIGTKFVSKRESVRKVLKKSVLNAFQKSIEFAIREDLDGVLIAGDLFDGGKIPFHGEVGFLKMMSSLENAGIHAFYTTGNHDPYQANDFFESLKKYQFIHPFYSREAQTIEVTSKSGATYTVVSAGHDSPAVAENIIKSFPVKEKNKTYIGIGHTMVASVNESVDHGNYMPCSLEDLKSKQYDYFALGHIHKTMALDEEGRIRYAGNIQGRHINETGPKGGWLIELDDQRFKSSFVPFHEVEWQQLTVTLKPEDETMYDVMQRIKVALQTEQSESVVKKIYRLYLNGETSLYDRLQSEESIEELEESIEALDHVLAVTVKSNGISPLVDREELKQGEHFLGSFLNEFDRDKDQFKQYLSDIPYISDRAKNNRSQFIEETLETLDDALIQKMKKQV